MSEYTVCRQEWRHFPRVLVMRNAETGEERRYVPERTCRKLPQESDTICEVHSGHFTASFGYWTCSECGCENFEGARYCMNCGAEAVE